MLRQDYLQRIEIDNLFAKQASVTVVRCMPGVATMAALIECVIVPGANSRLPCNARRECSTRCHKEDLALSRFRSREAELALSSTRRRSFGRTLRGLRRQQADEILSEKLTLGRHTERASISTRAGPPGDDEKETDSGEHRLLKLVERILRFLFSTAK